MNINSKKSKILLFGTAKQRLTYATSNWLFDNFVLEQVDEYPYLGILIHYSGSFKRAKKALYNKALRAYHAIFKSFSNFENLPVNTLQKLFSATVSPVLIYSCEIWEFCKRILEVHAKSTNLAVYAELGKIPLITKISIHQ